MLRAGSPPSRKFSLLALVLLSFSGAHLLTACSEPTRAKVVSREQPAYKTTGRPSRYKVRRGDTLYTIAWNYGLDFRTLARWNGIDYPYTIYPGQTHSLTGAVSRRRPAPPPKPVQRPEANKARTADSPGSRSEARASTGSGKAAKSVAEADLDSNRRFRWQWPTRGRVEQGFSGNDPSRKGIKIAGTRGQPVRAADRAEAETR